MENPYKILGVSPNASDDEIRKAYRELAKKYHPDNYVNNPLADLASEKMKEINEAYETIKRIRSGRNTNNGTYGEAKQRTETEMRVRTLIEEGRVSEAEVLLNRVHSSERGAEWNFLIGLVYMKKGWLFEARRHAEIANRMDPTNQEYIALLNSVSGPATQTNTAGCSICDMCAALMCMDCLCGCLR